MWARWTAITAVPTAVGNFREVSMKPVDNVRVISAAAHGSTASFP
jgi:hypothetical protein